MSVTRCDRLASRTLTVLLVALGVMTGLTSQATAADHAAAVTPQAGTPPADQGQVPTRAERRQTERSVQREAEQAIEAQRAGLVQEAAKALEEIQTILELLADEEKARTNTEKIFDLLRSAIGRLELVMARDPQLAAAPVDVRPILIEFGGTLEEVRATRETIVAMVEEERLQPARRALQPFAEEIVVRVIQLPLAAYRDALLLTARLVDQARHEEARTALETVLNTVVASDDILPLPLLRATAWLDQAVRLLETGQTLTAEQRAAAEAEARARGESGKVDETEDPAVLLREAERELARAEAFGYITADTLDSLRERLDDIRDQLKDRASAAASIKALMENIRTLWGDLPSEQDNAGDRAD